MEPSEKLLTLCNWSFFFTKLFEGNLVCVDILFRYFQIETDILLLSGPTIAIGKQVNRAGRSPLGSLRRGVFS